MTVHKIKTLALKTVFYTNTQQFFDFYTHNPAGILHRLFIDWVPIKGLDIIVSVDIYLIYIHV